MGEPAVGVLASPGWLGADGEQPGSVDVGERYQPLRASAVLVEDGVREPLGLHLADGVRVQPGQLGHLAAGQPSLPGLGGVVVRVGGHGEPFRRPSDGGCGAQGAQAKSSVTRGWMGGVRGSDSAGNEAQCGSA